MELNENIYQEMKKISFKQRTGKDLVYPPPEETCKETRTNCPECKDYLSMDSDGKNHIYYECWSCGWIEYVSPERHKRIMGEIDEIPF